MTTSTDPASLIRHEGLFTDPDGRHQPRLTSWLRTAAEGPNKIIAVAPPADRHLLADDITATTLSTDGHEPATQLREHLQRAVDEGFRGLGVVIWADGVVARTSAPFHAVVETALEDLCRTGHVSALCLYDRRSLRHRTHPDDRDDRDAADLLGLAIGRHDGGLHDDQLTVRRHGGELRLTGEVDADNVDFLTAALDAAGDGDLDLAGVDFVSVGAAQVIVRHIADVRAWGGRAEVRGARAGVRRVLQLVGTIGAR